MKATSLLDNDNLQQNQHERILENTIKQNHHLLALQQNQLKLPELGGFTITQVALSSLLISILFALSLGSLIFLQMNSRTLFNIDYTFCNKINSTNVTCQSLIDKQMNFFKPIKEPCICRIKFELDYDIHNEKINFYYGLRLFYQNYRFLAQSKDSNQLRGIKKFEQDKRCLLSQPSQLSNDLNVMNENNNNNYYYYNNLSYYPCGGLANIMFDDKYELYYANDDNKTIKLDTYNIALDNIRDFHYKNNNNFKYEKIDKNSSLSVKPPRWSHDIWSLDKNNQLNNGVESGSFIVWMTQATFNEFYKLYSIITPDEGILRKGQYMIDINYNYGLYDTSETRKLLSIVGIGNYGSLNIRLVSFLLILIIIYFFIFVIITLKLHQVC